MTHTPTRPFESLDWYRDAERRGFRDDRPQRGILPWLMGRGFFVAHMCVFAIGIVALYLINLIVDPADAWAPRWILAWTTVLLIHAIALGLLWAIRQYSDGGADEPLIVPVRTSDQGWANPPAGVTNAHDVDFRVTGEQGTPAPDTPWQGWRESDREREIPESERASWSEATTAAWLDRSARRAQQGSTSGETTSE